jgi:flagellar basal body-associated protein FliL
MTGHKNDPWDKPWVTIAMIVGILAVVVIALIFFMGSGNTSDQSLPVKTTPTPSGAGTQATLSGTTVAPQITVFRQPECTLRSVTWVVFQECMV